MCILSGTYFTIEKNAEVEKTLRQNPVLILGDKAVISTKRDSVRLVIYRRTDDSVVIKGDINAIKDTTP